MSGPGRPITVDAVLVLRASVRVAPATAASFAVARGRSLEQRLPRLDEVVGKRQVGQDHILLTAEGEVERLERI